MKGDLISIVVSQTESSIYSKSNSESVLPSMPDEDSLNVKIPNFKGSELKFTI